MANPITTRLQESLDSLKVSQQYRQLPNLDHQGLYVTYKEKNY